MASQTLAEIGFKSDTRDLDKANRKLNTLAVTGSKTEKSLSKSNRLLSKSFVVLAGAVTTAYAAFQSGSKLVNITREFDVLNSQLITATGNAKNAAVAFEAIQKFAADTPFDLAQATNAFTQLVNLGLTPSEAALTSYGNTASAMGKDLSQMIEAVADATVGEFERLKEFGIKAKSEGDNVSLTFRGVSTTIKKEAGAIEGYLMSLGQNEFAGAMAARAATLDGALSNMGDTWDNLFLTISSQGVGEAIQDGVMMATAAIQLLSDMIASGSLANSFDAFIGRFDGFVGDVSSAFNIISAIIGESTKGWGKSTDLFFNNMLNGFKQLPDMVRFFTQAATTELARNDQEILAKFDAFIDIVGLRFDMLVEKAKLDGRLIANALNPFSDDIDYDGQRKAIIDKFAAQEAAIISLAEGRVSALTDLSDELINAYALESVAATDNYKERIKLSNQLLENYKKEKAAKKGDTLSQFKIEAKEIDVVEGKIKSLKQTVDKVDIFGGMTDSIGTALSAMKGLTAEGSKEQAKLQVAIAATNAVAAIGAVINQGQGDPYSAFGRMAAMAASMAALGQSIGSLGGGLTDDSAQNQADQGLNIWGEKSESILSSIETTANATEQLVGINTGMLNALTSLQAGISGAAGISARGISGAEFSDLPKAFDFARLSIDPMEMLGLDFLGDWIGKGIAKIFGGSSKVTDSGIQIMGGALSDMIAGASVFAFQDVKSKRTIFSSTKRNTELTELEGASKQFALVFDSLAMSVFEGGKALGISTSELENSINEFEIATAKISLKDLGIEEQQAEIEAVFSQIFDNLAASVIPFIDEFQKIGESLGETLARVATQVQITEFAAENLGIQLGVIFKPSSEILAVISDELATLVGGVEEFAIKTAGFFDTFAPESAKFEVLSKSLAEQLSAVNLAVPETADGFFALMGSLNAFTSSGQNQIATLLNVQDTAKDYYDLLEDRSDKAASELSSKIALEERAASDQLRAQEQAASELQSFNNSLLSLSSNLRGAIVGIHGTEVETSKLSLTAALEAARLGDFSKALDLNLSSLSPSMEGFESLTAFNIDQAVTANKLAELADLTAMTATVEDMTLTAAQEQVTLLTSINSNIATAYVPQQTVAINNDTMVTELRAIKQELASMKKTGESNATSNSKSEQHLQFLELDAQVAS